VDINNVDEEWESKVYFYGSLFHPKSLWEHWIIAPNGSSELDII